jgi:glycosyltransferase involved in cell wall biosynthesis
MPIPRITIVTPSLNQGQFLETCIRSVIDQHYPDLEYLFVDGGSTDNSLEIARRYAHHFAWWVSETDRGQSEAINKGLRRATGQLVAWLNADDFLLPGALGAVARAWEENPRASFYYGDGLRVAEDGTPLRKFFPDEVRHFELDAMIFGLNYILQPATFINCAFFAQTDYLAEDLHYGLDNDLWIRLARLSPPCPVQAVLAASREWGDTKTSTGSFRRIEELRRLAERHSGQPITPGVLCYQMDTFRRYAQEHPELYPQDYLTEIDRFWAATARLMERFHARPDGFPMTAAEMASPTQPRRSKTSGGLRRLARRLLSLLRIGGRP